MEDDERRSGALSTCRTGNRDRIASSPWQFTSAVSAVHLVGLDSSFKMTADDRFDVEFRIIQGDIAEQSADALVNAAGTSLRMGSGVAGALRRAAGGDINREAVSKGPIELGAVAVTDAYDLDAEYVIHAAAMPHYGNGKATEGSIRTATENALLVADENGCSSLVIPALGCGVAGFDLSDGAEIIGETIDGYAPQTLSDVRFIAYGDSEFETVRDATAPLRSDE